MRKFKQGDQVLVAERFQKGNYYHATVIVEVATNKYLVSGADFGSKGKLPARAFHADLMQRV